MIYTSPFWDSANAVSFTLPKISFTYQYVVEINPKVKQRIFEDTLVTSGGD